MKMENRRADDEACVVVLPQSYIDPQAAHAMGRQTSERTSMPVARILLVDNSEIEQFVARETLLRAGYQCDLAASGRAAVEVILDDDFDLIMMDCQRDTDGLEAVRAIRRHERGLDPDGDYEPLPIVALTGGATHEDRQRCLSAGADACVSLPIDAGQLIGTIDCLLSVRRYDPLAADSRSEVPAEPAAFDVDALLHRCLGDGEFSAQILQKFAARADGQRAALQRAVASGNLDDLRREAHSLKGVAANLSADTLRSRAARLELAARTSQTQGLSKLLADTCDELARCVATIPKVLGRLTPGL